MKNKEDIFENLDAFLGSDLDSVVIRHPIDNRDSPTSPVCCEHPSILFNPNWYDNFMRFGEMIYNNTIYKYSNYCELSVDDLRRKLFLDIHPNLDNFNKLVIPRPGREDFCVLMAVPCGRCDFCRVNKSAEYAFRSSCETAIYPDHPLFITITYNDKYLPKDGLDITEFQKFMKKLRFHLSQQKETSNVKVQLRYLAVGEYGSKYGRPHFHLILWNMPIDCFRDKVGQINYHRLYSSIYKSWLSYKLNQHGQRQYVKTKFGKLLPVMESKGIVKILPVENGCTNYITKYFRKEPKNKCNYPAKPFLCSSRKNGGIGSKYIRSKRDDVFRNRFSTNLKISVQDPISGKVFSRGITNYLKYLLFPSKSQVYNRKKHHYDICKSIEIKYEKMMACVSYYRDKFDPGFKIFAKGRELILNLRDFITFRPYIFYRTVHSYLKKWHHTELLIEIKHKIAEIDMLYSLLDIDFIKMCRNLMYERSEYLKARERCRVSVAYNLLGQRDNFDCNYNRYLQKCIF